MLCRRPISCHRVRRIVAGTLRVPPLYGTRSVPATEGERASVRGLCGFTLYIACFTFFISLLPALPAFAHGDRPDSPDELWERWGLDPGVLIPLALSAALYLRGVLRLWSQSGPGRGIRRW